MLVPITVAAEDWSGWVFCNLHVQQANEEVDCSSPSLASFPGGRIWPGDEASPSKACMPSYCAKTGHEGLGNEARLFMVHSTA